MADMTVEIDANSDEELSEANFENLAEEAGTANASGFQLGRDVHGVIVGEAELNLGVNQPPISQERIPDLLAKSFPVLFPTGVGDLYSPQTLNPPTLA